MKNFVSFAKERKGESVFSFWKLGSFRVFRKVTIVMPVKDFLKTTE